MEKQRGMETFSFLTPTPSPARTHLLGHSPPSPSRPVRVHPSPSRLSDHPDQPHEMPPAPRPRGCPTEEAAQVLHHSGEDSRGRVPVTLPRHLRGRWQPTEHQLGRVPHSCHRTAPRELSGTRPAASGVSRRAAGVLLIPPQHHPIIQHRRDPPAAPGPRHRGTDKLRRLQAPPEPRSLLSPACACPLPLPPSGRSSSHECAGTPAEAALTGKPPDSVTQPEIAPAEARTAHPATKL